MNVLRLPPAAFVFLAFLSGCGAEDAALETRTFEVRHLSVEGAYALVEPYVFDDHPERPGRIFPSGEGRALTVRERADNLDRIARVLEERDRPVPSAHLRFLVIEATDGPQTSDPPPAEVEEALREVFRFEGYALVGETVAHVAEGGTTTQSISGPLEMVSGELQRVEHREDGTLSGRVEVMLWTDPGTRALVTTVNVREGQTVVVGTAGDGLDGGALILAVHAEFEG